jgi:tRNA(Ile)-lysidine synthase
VKEVLERLHVSGAERAQWPVVELDGRILWMQGVEVQPEPGIEITVSPLEDKRTEARPAVDV